MKENYGLCVIISLNIFFLDDTHVDQMYDVVHDVVQMYHSPKKKKKLHSTWKVHFNSSVFIYLFVCFCLFLTINKTTLFLMSCSQDVCQAFAKNHIKTRISQKNKCCKKKIKPMA